LGTGKSEEYNQAPQGDWMVRKDLETLQRTTGDKEYSKMN